MIKAKKYKLPSPKIFNLLVNINNVLSPPKNLKILTRGLSLNSKKCFGKVGKYHPFFTPILILFLFVFCFFFSNKVVLLLFFHIIFNHILFFFFKKIIFFFIIIIKLLLKYVDYNGLY